MAIKKKKPELKLVHGQQVEGPQAPKLDSQYIVLIPRQDGGVDLVEYTTYYRLVLQKPVVVEVPGNTVSYEPGPSA